MPSQKNQKNQKQRGGWAPVSAGTGAGSGTSGEFGYEPTRGAPLSSPFKVRSRKMRGGAFGDGTGAGAGAGGANLTGSNALPKGAAISGVVNSEAAMFGKIPLNGTEQGMSFLSRTATFHRSRKALRRRQRGGGGGGGALNPATVESSGDRLPPSMTGAMTTDGTGGSGTGVLDAMLVETLAFPKQTGGGSRRRNRNRNRQSRNRQSRNRNRNRQQQNRNRQQQNRSRKQRGGSSSSLGYGPAVPPSGDYTTGVDLQKAGLNPQWFNEGKVNNQFPMSVPGGKLN